MSNTNVTAFVSEYTRERPNFGPMQIRSPKELWPGRKLFACTSQSPDKVLVEILSKPYSYHGKLRCEARFWSGKDGCWFVRVLYLEDRNVVSYQNKTWSPYSWLERRFRFLFWI